MGSTLVAFTESQDSASLVNVAALADQHVRTSGDDLVVPEEYNQVIAAYALGPNVTRAQLVSPTLRRFINQEIRPIDVAALPASPVPINDYRGGPLVLDPDELLNVQAAEDAAGASRATIGVWLSNGEIAPVAGDIRSVRFTTAFTLTANAWTNGAITLDQTLPAGLYQLVGASFISTNAQLFRFVFVGGIWRPGGVGNALVSDLDLMMFRNGNLGVWGEFRHNLPPTIDVLGNGADTSGAGILDLVQVG